MSKKRIERERKLQKTKHTRKREREICIRKEEVMEKNIGESRDR